MKERKDEGREEWIKGEWKTGEKGGKRGGRVENESTEEGENGQREGVRQAYKASCS